MDEFTRWIFDFTGDPKYDDFQNCMDADNAPQLASAILTLQRYGPPPPFSSTATDGISMLAKVLPGLNPAPAVNSTSQNLAIQAGWGPTLVHNWVPPDGNAIFDNFRGNGTVTQISATVGNGHIAMQYQDDAAIRYASLELTCGSSVGGTVDLLTNTDSADSPAAASGSSSASDYTSPVAAAIAAAFVALMAGGWYVRRRWLR